MNIEEEKIFVLEKLMEREIFAHTSSSKDYYFEDDDENRIRIRDWNPQLFRNRWDEIWEKMSESELSEKYLDVLDNWILENFICGGRWELHTAEPEVCWKALIKTLEEM